MKKIVLSVFFFGLIVSCSSNDDSTPTPADPNTTDCDCGRIVRSNTFTIVNTPESPTPTTTFTTYVVLNNCSNLESTTNVNGNQLSAYPVGRYICN